MYIAPLSTRTSLLLTSLRNKSTSHKSRQFTPHHFFFLMYHSLNGLHKSSPPWMLSQSLRALCTNLRVHSLFVGRLVLQATVKVAVGMGYSTVHNYGSLSHPVSCQCTHTNTGSHHRPLQQTGCVLPWFTVPSHTAKQWWQPIGWWWWWWWHIYVTNTSDLHEKTEYAVNLGMIFERNSMVLKFVMCEWYHCIDMY